MGVDAPSLEDRRHADATCDGGARAPNDLTVYASSSVGPLSERITTGVCEAWESVAGTPPTVAFCSIDELLATNAAPQAHAALVILGADAPQALAPRIVDAMHRALAPGVVLLPCPSDRARRLAGGGVLIASWDAAPLYLSATLHALTQRQRMLIDLRAELERTTLSQGGMRGQMARLHDELNLAASIQRDLLPRAVPAVPGVEFGVVFRPASYVSGDIYDVSMLTPDTVGFFLADAVGHGVPAALLTIVISRGLRSGAMLSSVMDPGEALSRLNDEMIACQRESNRFATAVAGVMNVRTGEVTIASAGHPPALVMRRGGHEALREGGALLGIFPDQTFPTTTLHLHSGETLLLYSDGFEAAFAEDGRSLRGETPMYLRELDALPWPNGEEHRTVAGALAALEARVDGQSGSLHQRDDLTAIAMAVRAPARVARAA